MWLLSPANCVENVSANDAGLATAAAADAAQSANVDNGVDAASAVSETTVSAAADVVHDIINRCKGDLQVAKERLHEMGMSLPSSFSNLGAAPALASGAVAYSVLQSCGGNRAAAAEKLQEMGLLLPPPLHRHRADGTDGREKKRQRAAKEEFRFNALTAEDLAAAALCLAASAVCTHATASAFVRRMRRMLAEGGDSRASVSVVFHWTPRKNFRKIDEMNLQVPNQENGVLHQTDEGFYGKGIYTSPNFDLYRGYGGDAERSFLCLGLPGRQFPAHFPEHMGANLQSGFDSHISGDDNDGPTGSQWVFFSTDQLLALSLVDGEGVDAARAAAEQVIRHLSSNIAYIEDDPSLGGVPRASATSSSSKMGCAGTEQLKGCASCGGPRRGWEGCSLCASTDLTCASLAPNSNSLIPGAEPVMKTPANRVEQTDLTAHEDSSFQATCLVRPNAPKYFFRD